ncbi:MAG: hypothetical protein QM796_17335 [Chthoniobacteraceae bacterium]
MKFLLLLIWSLVATASTLLAQQDTYELYKIKVVLPVRYQSTDSKGHPLVKTITLDNADIINLALGRSLSTNVDPTLVTLVLAGDASTPGTNSFVGIYNLKYNFITVVWTLPTFILANNGDDYTKDYVFTQVDVPATNVNDYAHWGFLDSTFYMGGYGSRAGSGKLDVSAKSVCGQVNLTLSDSSNTATIYNGFLTNGTFTITTNSFKVISFTPPN